MEENLRKLRGHSERINLDEVAQIFVRLSRLIALQVAARQLLSLRPQPSSVKGALSARSVHHHADAEPVELLLLFAASSAG